MTDRDKQAESPSPLHPFAAGFTEKFASTRGFFVRVQSRPTLLGRLSGLVLTAAAVGVAALLLLVALVIGVVVIPVLGVFLLAKGALGRLGSGSVRAGGRIATDGIQRENVRVIRPNSGQA